MNIRQVPVVDISTLTALTTDAKANAALLNPDDEMICRIIEEVRAAATEWGFFYIANHGLLEQEVETFKVTMCSFFSLPKDVKNTVRRKPTNSRGYYDSELTKNKRDNKEVFDLSGANEDGPAQDGHERLNDDENQWLNDTALPNFHKDMLTYYDKMEYISRRLLKVFAVALGEQPSFFDQFYQGDNSSYLRLNYYPKIPEPEKTMGVYHHTDSGALTVLLQDDEVASLQVFHRESQTWINVPPRKGTYTINIGDMVQVWSNDQFVAPLHRVLASGEADRPHSKAKMDVCQVPVIDIGALTALTTDAEVNAALINTQDEALHRIIDEVRAAATEWGFFYIANHGLPEKEVEKLKDTVRSFFRLPKDVKNTIRRQPTNSRGYFDSELTKNKTDWKEVFDFAGADKDGLAQDNHECLGDDRNQWLDEDILPGFYSEMLTYFSKMEYISRRLLKVFAVALGEKPAFFDQFYEGDNSSLMRLNHYPVAPEPEKTMGVYHHTDIGALTVLLQDDEVATLQVFHRESKTWTFVSPIKGTYTINIGDMVQVWSNDQFVAPMHRVIASNKASRFSVPFFYNPFLNTQVEPIVVKQGDVAKYRPLSYREFLLQRMVGNYADVGKENQINDYKIDGSIKVRPAS
ncbi:hypothetical protein BBO99_00009404 [Phytophthora kernoviae]|uniref:Fe2OG dioxygenase domain-containing protein n=1 Tax=Phytophthora kernoviae TaxID=325452 RepID=A0A3R7H7Y2_9STRA|nr:hypothetical protein JM16_009311 [Phytophthora kernoviae]RLN31951.1 hypothetical protein BBI17_009435 [Phytophthora kernoviae]RLN73441.1 hypothetical protein BBO99_00009404 [Phytophthora kernoviae]